MSEAQAKEDNSGRRGKADLIEKFREEYTDALSEARIQAEHTMTEGWRTLYTAERKLDRDERRKLGERLEQIGKWLSGKAWQGEEMEKEIGDIKKSAGILRERREHFDLTTVGPIKACVDACHEVVNEARAEARLLQDRTPLLNSELVERMQAATENVPRVEWDEEKGMVVIGNRGKSSAN